MTVKALGSIKDPKMVYGPNCEAHLVVTPWSLGPDRNSEISSSKSGLATKPGIIL